MLLHLLLDIDARFPERKGRADIYFQRMPVDAKVQGGMGGGIITDGLWLHKEVEGIGIRSQIGEILAGRRERLEGNAKPGAAADGAGV